MVNITGLSLEEIQGKKLWEIGCAKNKEHSKRAFTRLKTNGYIRFEDMPILNRNGNITEVEIVSNVYSENNHKVIQSNIRDITENKLAYNKLHESELRFKQVSESANEWIWEVDINGMYTYVNPIVKKLLGYQPEELIGRKYFYDFFEPEKKEELKQDVFEVFKRKESVRDLTNCNIHKDGRKVFLSTTGFPILDKNNKLIGYRGVNVDITEHKHFLETLKSNEQKFMALAEQSPNLIFINFNGRYVYVNKKCVDALGYSKEEFYSDDFNFLNVIADEYKELTRENNSKHEQGIEIEPHDYALITKNGKRLDVILTINLIDYADGKASMGTAMDITERKRAEAVLSRERKKDKSVVGCYSRSDIPRRP